ncbi:MAG: polysaccharide biosynthesis protein [Streptosporangiaceae bacterium]|nr:polysaccharide biosynthesis protein [Streptosporangiaceae bacterium]MBV9853310.1 polysaccharide biosynthesis protein [Streptosporangiaceae bacterium]
MKSVPEIIGMMRAAAPDGQARLGEESLQRLRDLTRALITAKPDAVAEHARFLAIGERALCLPEAALAARLGGRCVLVTGGTGCIGSALMGQLAARCPGRLVSVSRGVTGGWPRQAGAEYRYADIRDRGALNALIGELSPDVVFHVAAQRDPGLAEADVHRTVSTNVLGARNVLEAAAEAGVPQVVLASTGKALRPYSPDVYAASKRAAEWVASTFAASGEMLCAAGRFTHVLDNSIIYRRLRNWAALADGGVIRLHSPDIVFYVQSALESAQLLLLAVLGSAPGEFRVHAITDLDWPVSLLDVALGVLAGTGSAAPVYVSGYDLGYEEVPFPGLYDPATAGEVSPLLNAFETAARTGAPCPMTDTFVLGMAPDPGPAKLLAALDEVCGRTRDPREVRAALDELSWALLDATLRAAPRRALARAAAVASSHRAALGPGHRRVLEAIRVHADVG